MNQQPHAVRPGIPMFRPAANWRMDQQAHAIRPGIPMPRPAADWRMDQQAHAVRPGIPMPRPAADWRMNQQPQPLLRGILVNGPAVNLQPDPVNIQLNIDRRRIVQVIQRDLREVQLHGEELEAAVNGIWEVFPDIDGDLLHRWCAHFDRGDLLQYFADATPSDIPRRALPKPNRPAVRPVDEDNAGAPEPNGAPPVLDKDAVFKQLSRFFAPAGVPPDNERTFLGKRTVTRHEIIKSDQFKQRILGSLYPMVPIETVRNALAAFDSHLSPSFAALFPIANNIPEESIGGWQPSGSMRKLLRRGRADRIDALRNLPQYTPALRDEVATLIKIRDGLMEEEDPNAVLVECAVCFNEVSDKKMIACTGADGSDDDAHRFCVECVARQAEEAANGGALLAGVTGLPCMDPACDRIFMWKDFRTCLPAKIRRRLSDRFQEANLASAGLQNIERCKACNFAVLFDVPKTVDKVFRCPECDAAYCRICGEKWDDAHFGRKCTELDAAALNAYREKMTSALTRTCDRCRAEFEKDGGCNKLVCSSCGMTMCFLCRAKGIDYNHFCQHVRDPNFPARCPANCNRCLLFADEKGAVLKEINRIKQEARQDARIAGQISPDRKLPCPPPARQRQ